MKVYQNYSLSMFCKMFCIEETDEGTEYKLPAKKVGMMQTFGLQNI